MSIALRFIPTLIEETDKIMSAQKARGADFESGNLLQRAKALIPHSRAAVHQRLPPRRRAGDGDGVPLLPRRRGPHDARTSCAIETRGLSRARVLTPRCVAGDDRAEKVLLKCQKKDTIMRNIALILMYNGTAYHGWQVQKTEVTVAETLEKACRWSCGEPVHVTGCGRTDAGVHAERYVANFRTTLPHPRRPPALRRQHPHARGHRGARGAGGGGRFQRHRLVPEEGIHLPHLQFAHQEPVLCEPCVLLPQEARRGRDGRGGAGV